MGLALVLVGIIVWAFLNAFIGIILIIVGLVLIFVPGTPYGYGWYRGRRGPP